MDGTLVDTERLWWDAAEQVADSIGRPLTPADSGDVLGRPVAHTAAVLSASACPGAPPLEAVEQALDAAFITRVAHQIAPLPGALALLEALRSAQIPTAIVSASPRRVVDLVRDALGDRYFATTVAVEDTPATKPAADPYLQAAAILGVDPGRCVAVEDTPVGVAAAEAAGCTVVVVPSVEPVEAARGRTILDSLEHVTVELLARLASNAQD